MYSESVIEGERSDLSAVTSPGVVGNPRPRSSGLERSLEFMKALQLSGILKVLADLVPVHSGKP